ncbi:hypothetical protein DKX38_017006 [Salix brachista]|uniref:non-specific serine/threonine protein kinase n=1 Tax=Salix brachista TaxID=2182728 RepID=A0A5N5KU17_9ROSI|nr:hypothetical protein DKX38_017006 [Salix brachista]
MLLTSWTSVSDPSIGNISGGIDPSRIPQFLIWNGTRPIWRTGPWNGQVFIGIPEMVSVYFDGFNIADEGNGTFTLSLGFANESLISNYILSSEGKFGKVLWDDSKGSWRYEWQFPKDECDFYGKCGPFGSCDARDSPICSCLKGFEPKNADEWNNGNWTSGCFRRRELQCERIQNGGQVGKEDGFLKLERMKVPDFSEWLSSKSEQTCKNECLNINCSCIAYSYYSGFGCMLWRGNLTDLKKFHIEAADLYIRLADSEIDNKKTNMKVIISLTVVVGVIAVAICVFFSWRRIDEEDLSLLGYAWKLWNQGNIAALVDPGISYPSFHEEIFRCVHVGLLCVQEFAKDRPAIFTVISMLKSEIVDLPTPKQPAFSERRGELDTESFQRDPRQESINNVTGEVLWSSNVSHGSNQSTAQLDDDGSLVLKSGPNGNQRWTSFQEPTDTYLTKIRLSANARTGKKRLLTSWRSSSDPSVGNFSTGINPSGIPELFMWYNGHPYWRSGPWVGQKFIGIPGMSTNVYLRGFSVQDEGDGTITLSSIVDPVWRLTYVLTSRGKCTEQFWDYEKQGWNYSLEVPSTDCDFYGKCGQFGRCDAQNSPICRCLIGFVPKNQDEWNKGIWTSGCVRKTSLQCDRIRNGSEVGKEDGFMKLETMKVPTFAEYWSYVPSSGSEQDCKDECLKNCSCVAYSYYNGFGCMAWTGNLIDIQKFSEGGADLNIRLAYTEFGMHNHCIYIKFCIILRLTSVFHIVITFSPNNHQYNILVADKNRNLKVIISVSVIGGATAIFICVFFSWKWMATHRGNILHVLLAYWTSKLYNFYRRTGKKTQITSWKNPSDPSVGSFSSGIEPRSIPEVFVWNDSRPHWRSGPWNGQAFIGIPEMSSVYLNGYNLVEDGDGTFSLSVGLANESYITTFALSYEGKFGEIYWDSANERWEHKKQYPGDDCDNYGTCGPFGFCNTQNSLICSSLTLISIFQAWKLWNEGNALALVDPALTLDQHSKVEIYRCIHVGFLCVQEFPKDRPAISTIISMLNSEIVDLPLPNNPAYTEREEFQVIRLLVTPETGQVSVYLEYMTGFRNSFFIVNHNACYDAAIDTITSSQPIKDPETVSAGNIFEMGIFRLFHSHPKVMALGNCKVSAALLLFLSCSCSFYGDAGDTITSSQPLKDPEAIVSAGNKFKLGFFKPLNSTDRYVGIWYSDISAETHQVVWVANRDMPINDSSGMMTIAEDGNIVVSNGQGKVLWSSNVSLGSNQSTAQLDDDGSLVLKSGPNGNQVWTSFQEPTDTYLTKMRLSANARTGKKRLLTSWRSSSDPSVGNFSTGINPSGIPELFMWYNGHPYWRSGPWVGQKFIGVQRPSNNVYITGFSVQDEGDGTITLSSIEDPVSRLAYVLTSHGKYTEQLWDYEKGGWRYDWEAPSTDCDIYGKCGPFGSCEAHNSPICRCLKGFDPKNQDEWNKEIWTSGCVRMTSLQCDRIQNGSEVGKEDRFMKLEMMKVPAFAEYWSYPSSSEQACKDECLKNCSCVAYSYYNDFGCMAWTGNLIDIQKFSEEGTDLNIRLAYTELDKKRNLKVIISMSVIGGATAIFICVFFSWKWMATHRERKVRSKETLSLKTRGAQATVFDGNLPENVKEVKLEPLFKLQVLETATNNFDISKKLGQGGFGAVYRVTLLE